MDRRRFLKTSATAGAGIVAATRFPDTLLAGTAALGDSPFRHGVASGDPRHTNVVIWTRVTPNDKAIPGSEKGKPVNVRWQVADDDRFRRPAAEGRFTTSRRTDHIAKIDVTGLEPGREYVYRFSARGKRSRVGRLKTAPTPDARNQSATFGMVSCSNYEGGYFSAYRHLAQRNDLDFVMHLGDYIYEYEVGKYGPGPEIGRSHDPEHEIVSLSDYRRRFAQYRQDPDLQELHAVAPFITIWDDHEVTNDTYDGGAENHQPDTEGDFYERRDRAYQAYFEWMPLRDRRNGYRLYRRFRFGTLADLHMLDLRQYRNQQPANQGDPAKDDPGRTMTGNKQLAWLKKGLVTKDATWKLVGNQVMFIPFDTAPDVPFNIDAWDGYRAERAEIVQHLADNEASNVVFLTGDIHTSWAAEVPLNKAGYPVIPPAATEFVCPSITSDNLDEITGSPYRSSIPVEEGIKAENRWVKHVELDSHGYSVINVNPERLQMDLYYISDRTDPEATQAFASSWQTAVDSNEVTEASDPIPTER